MQNSGTSFSFWLRYDQQEQSTGSQVGEDPQNFIDEVKKIFGVMQVTDNGRVELASYQLKDVAHILITWAAWMTLT
ncbi:hypothetical protein MTR67_002203 [Solanum verrucosum]|uniref:Gag-pol polyprotein n=1 Tax=Solanum verrucosum TaxID=315347 RepID=A0AAF0PPI0_SOLVR|nr:hypothetical protein MTR67_002203 [Solanum verrucosum]